MNVNTDTLVWSGPIPTQCPETAPFWQACNEGVFLIQRCEDCGKTQYPYRSMCCHCWSDRIRDLPIRGQGTVWTFSVVQKNRTPAFVSRGAYVVAVIELPEAVKVISNIVGFDPNSISIGMPVELAFAVAEDGSQIPVFVVKAEAS